MPKIRYQSKRFQEKSLVIIDRANRILEEYTEKGFDLTLRQLYYQFVARNLIENTQRSYKNIGTIINDARLAGLVDWDYIVDRTRNLEKLSNWENPSEILESAAQSYHIDMWKNQDYYVEVWIEKDALIGVIERICNKLDIPYFSCRGYTSQSEMWRASKRIIGANHKDKEVVILQLSDHDPSGIDMTRDIENRIEMFCAEAKIKRLALSIEQVRQYKSPPNPAKTTDSRYREYQRKYGTNSWELDALNPEIIENLIDVEVRKMINTKRWNRDLAKKKKDKKLLADCSGRWPEIKKHLLKKGNK